MKIMVSQIRPNPQQPRTYFDPGEMQELAASIHENGLQSPVLVEDSGSLDAQGKRYTLVAGERRVRAFEMLGLAEIEAIIRESTNHEGLQRLLDAMTENVQRASMTPIEEARGYQRLRDEHHMSANQISKRMGVSLNSVLGRLKLIELEPEIQELIQHKALPASQEPIDALLSIPAGETRVKLATGLAERSATIRMVRNACEKTLATLAAEKPQGRYSKAPGIYVGAKKAKLNPDDLKDEWDALYQVNRVPPWPLYVDSIQQTCMSCAFYSTASDSTCRDCPLVASVRRMMEAVDAKRH
jgi:ParB family chromosome partitioning protein